jgi:hypothetical protein
MSRRSSLAGPLAFAFAFARTRIFVPVRSSCTAMPHNGEGFIDRRIDFLFRNAVNLVRPPIQKRLQIPCHCGPVFWGWSPLRRNGHDAN